MYKYLKLLNSLLFILLISNLISAKDKNEELDKIYSFLDSLVVKNIINKKNTELSLQYKYMKGIEGITIYKKERVFLNYDGLSSGGIWSKPGAKNFGGERVGTFYFNNGPVAAYVVGHKELPGNRNYFYILIDSEEKEEGWVGRPYVMIDKEGKRFLMPNPMTGETIREITEVKFDITAIRKLMVEEPIYYQNYAPRYNEIPWNECLCSLARDFQEEGYRLYLDALEDGRRQVDIIVNNYLILNTPY